MRAVEVDERDNNWWRDDARFRVYVFIGSGNAVATTDLLGASVDEALEEAAILAEDNQRLWSLALVHDDPQHGRGLIWLSGNDYNDDHTFTSAYWRARALMQDRYLMAKVRRGEEPVLPSGLRVIRMFPEWTVALPLWESFTDNYPVEPGALGLANKLERELEAWNEEWQLHADTDNTPHDWVPWEERGRVLYDEVCRQLHGIAEVRPEFLRD